MLVQLMQRVSGLEKELSFMVKGKRMIYKQCYSIPLNEAKERAKKTCFPIYLGSSKVWYYNGKRQQGKEVLHFFSDKKEFVKKDKVLQRKSRTNRKEFKGF